MTLAAPTAPVAGSRSDRRAPALSAALVALVVALTALGSWLAASALSGGGAGVSGGPARVGAPLQAPFGLVTVTSVDTVSGLAASDLGGMSHGVSGLVGADQQLVQVQLRLSGRDGGRGDFAPSNFHVVRSAGGKPVAPAAGSLSAARLLPGANIEGSLGFVVPRDGSRLSLAVPIAAGKAAALVPLGTAQKGPAAPAQGGDEHSGH